MPSYRRLQQCAIAISILSVLYNGVEGGFSIAFGAESSSRSLIFFGIQSAIEVASSTMVLWRFRTVAKPGEEHTRVLGPRELRMEKFISGSIGGLLLALAVSTEAAAIVGLVLHQEPDGSNSSLIISASALALMILIWLPKPYLARALNSSAMQGEATCSLSCIQITIVLFIGSLVFRVWRGGWWVDSATSLFLGILFGREGWKMVRWVRDPAFDGGCDCGSKKTPALQVDAELGERYRDLCECCLEKSECNQSGECKCVTTPENESLDCCKPISGDGSKCCTHSVIQAPHLKTHTDPCCGGGAAAPPCSTGTCNEGSAAPDSCKGKDIATTGGACSGYSVSEQVTKPGSCCGEQTAVANSSCCK